jgi:hypothetical protein
VIGEQRGEGVRICSRCLWDADTDNLASQIFINVRQVNIIIRIWNNKKFARFCYFITALEIEKLSVHIHISYVNVLRSKY